MATGIVMCGQGWGVLILSPLLQTMIATLGWQNTYKIMAGVVPVLRLSGFTYSLNVQIPDIDKNVAEKDAEITSGGENPKEGQGRMELWERLRSSRTSQDACVHSSVERTEICGDCHDVHSLCTTDSFDNFNFMGGVRDVDAKKVFAMEENDGCILSD